MSIIKLNKKNIKELAEIDFESEHQNNKLRNITKSKIKKDLIKRFNQGHELFFGYKENNELEGYATLKPFFPGCKHCEIYWIAVKKKYQGKKVGTKLMKYLENFAKKKGFRKVCLYTNKNMKKARKFYEKLGYKKINEFPGYYGYKKNTTAVLYVKKCK